MRIPRPRSLCALAIAVVVLGLSAGAAPADDDERAAEAAAAWQGILGSRAPAQLAGRWIVVLDRRSVADRVARAGGGDGAQMRLWAARARREQEAVLARLAFRGAPVQPEHSYVRVLNGFAAALDARALRVIQTDTAVAAVYPVRAVYPAAVEERGGAFVNVAATGVGIPGFTGKGVTVALIDTGVDLDHPFLEGRLAPGIDILDPEGDAHAQQNPTAAGQPERHATELAGLVAGANGPQGLRGVAPEVTILPIRAAGWQPEIGGGVAVYGRTDQVLAGFEAAVDPNGDGDVHDAARIALVGLSEPYASFPDSPLARAAGGANTLGTLVVAPVGNDGPSGPVYGNVGAPAAAATALAVAAADVRSRTTVVHVLVRTGLRVMLSGAVPLGGSAAPEPSLHMEVVAVAGRRPSVVTTDSRDTRFYDQDGHSRVAGRAALLPAGSPTPEAIREAASAGALAVLVDGAVPSGSLDVDDPLQVPVVGLPAGIASEIRARLTDGQPVSVALGAPGERRNAEVSGASAFSSQGLAFDGSAKPELVAPGVVLGTAKPGRGEDGVARYGSVSGSSAAAAVTAGAAALLAEARPDLDADGLRAALVWSARPAPDASPLAGGLLDAAAAPTAELVADRATVTFGTLVAPGTRSARIVLRNVSSRALVARLTAQPPDGAALTVRPRVLRLRPGGESAVRMTVRVRALPDETVALTGFLEARLRGGGKIDVPWSLAVPRGGGALLQGVALTSATLKPSDVNPVVLSLVAGNVEGTAGALEVRPLELLTIDLFRQGRSLGTLVTLRDLLPGRLAFALTGRGPRGRRLARGTYVLRIVARPVGGGRPETATVTLRIT